MRNLLLQLTCLLVLLCWDQATSFTVVRGKFCSNRSSQQREYTGILFSTENDNMEKTWRYIKKPLLRVGSKGATTSHGNSLRELLASHKVVKVKVNGLKEGKKKVKLFYW